jgi:hypothetical protein|nr:MAG TPA: hypothetical protein [Caudoviricetes sp.]
MTKYVDIDAAKEAVRKAECNADYDGRRFDAEFIENALDFIPAADVAPVVHGKWITRNDKGVISMTHPYMCSRCWRVEMNKEPYCNCGAKMDGGES